MKFVQLKLFLVKSSIHRVSTKIVKTDLQCCINRLEKLEKLLSWQSLPSRGRPRPGFSSQSNRIYFYPQRTSHVKPPSCLFVSLWVCALVQAHSGTLWSGRATQRRRKSFWAPGGKYSWLSINLASVLKWTEAAAAVKAAVFVCEHLWWSSASFHSFNQVFQSHRAAENILRHSHHGAFKFSLQDSRGRCATNIKSLLIDRDQVFPKPASQCLAHTHTHTHGGAEMINQVFEEEEEWVAERERKRRRPSEREGGPCEEKKLNQ